MATDADPDCRAEVGFSTVGSAAACGEPLRREQPTRQKIVSKTKNAEVARDDFMERSFEVIWKAVPAGPEFGAA